jgi:hypothetical protein
MIYDELINGYKAYVIEELLLTKPSNKQNHPSIQLCITHEGKYRVLHMSN